MMQFGMPTLIENHTLEENVNLCNNLGLNFIELNMNFPEYQVQCLEETGVCSFEKDKRTYTIFFDQQKSSQKLIHNYDKFNALFRMNRFLT